MVWQTSLPIFDPSYRTLSYENSYPVRFNELFSSYLLCWWKIEENSRLPLIRAQDLSIWDGMYGIWSDLGGSHSMVP